MWELNTVPTRVDLMGIQMQGQFENNLLLASNCDGTSELLNFWVLQHDLQASTEKNINGSGMHMQVVDEPSIGLVYLRIREMIEPRIRWWLLHSARRL